MKIKIDINQSPLIPEGEYKLKCVDYAYLGWMFSGKLILMLEIVSEDKFNGTPLKRSYNYNKNKTPGSNSSLVREHRRLFGSSSSPDELDVEDFRGHVYLGKVKTVVKDPKKREIDKSLQYSQVDELISLDDNSKLNANSEPDESFDEADTKEERFDDCDDYDSSDSFDD